VQHRARRDAKVLPRGRQGNRAGVIALFTICAVHGLPLRRSAARIAAAGVL